MKINLNKIIYKDAIFEEKLVDLITNIDENGQKDITFNKILFL
jgi:hypothetical protein